MPVGAALPAVEASTEVGQQAGVCVRQAVEARFRLCCATSRTSSVDSTQSPATATTAVGMARGVRRGAGRGDRGVGRRRGRPDVLRHAGEEWADKAGGTSGALWGAGLLAAAERLPSATVPTDADVVAAVVNSWQQVKAIGGGKRSATRPSSTPWNRSP